MENNQNIKFIPMAERCPDPFEACLLLELDRRLSVACWISVDEANQDGNFRQGRNGVIGKEDVLAWIPIEKFSLSEGDKISFYYEDV